MGISLPAPTRSLLSGARHAAPLLLAGATYLVLGSDGLVHRTTGLKLAFWSLPLYGLAALLLASDLMRRFGRGRWAGPIAGLLSWLGYAVVAYGMVSGLASLASEMQRQPGRGAAGEALGPYFDHLAGLAPWIFIYILLEALY